MADYKLDAERLGFDPDPQRPPVPRQRLESRFNVARLVSLCLGLIALVAGFVVSKLGRVEPQPPAPAGAGRELKVEEVAGQLVLKWNKDSDAVRNVQRATLTITDGDHTEDVDLDLATVRSGSVVYTPGTTNVAFRLTVVSQRGEGRSESVRIVLERLTPHPLAVPSP